MCVLNGCWLNLKPKENWDTIINNRKEKCISCERPLSLSADINRKLFVSNTKLFVVVFNILLIVIVFNRIYLVFVSHWCWNKLKSLLFTYYFSVNRLGSSIHVISSWTSWKSHLRHGVPLLCPANCKKNTLPSFAIIFWLRPQTQPIYSFHFGVPIWPLFLW